jgi:hypothetical protein
VPTAPFKPGDDWLTKLRKVVFVELPKIVRKGTQLEDENSPEVVHLTYVLGIIHWKWKAGPRPELANPELSEEQRDALSAKQLAKSIRERGSVSSIPSVDNLAQQDMLAWEHWAQHGIWPEVQQGYAKPPSHPRWPMLEVADRHKKWRRLERLKRKKHFAEKGRTIEHDQARRRLEKQIDELEIELARLGQPELYKRNKHNDRRRALQAAQPILNKRWVAGWHDFAEELLTIFRAELPGQNDKAARWFVSAVVPVITGEDAPLEDTVEKVVNRAQQKRRDTAKRAVPS